VHPRLPVAALLLALGLTLAACEDPPLEGAPDGEATEAEADETADAAVGVTDTEIGEVLVDADGRTLYVFDSDEQGASTCYDDCADDWPALIGEHPVAAEGADEGLVGTATREDGSDQVTYDDWPLYYWAGDEERGDVDGHGVGGVWWTIDASGEPQRDTEEDEAAGDRGGGY
jgi:predicted lipoprotein with Yx(FWY)xxD motif